MGRASIDKYPPVKSDLLTKKVTEILEKAPDQGRRGEDVRLEPAELNRVSQRQAVR